MLQVGEMAPNFQSSALMPGGHIEQNFDFYDQLSKGDKACLFFYPLDFTFVCPSELLALHANLKAWKALGFKVFAISIDSVYVHLAWQKAPIEMGGLGAVDFPMVSDLKQEIVRLYGVQHIEGGVALRATVLMDENQIIRHFSFNDLPLGRNMDELLRIAAAMNHHATSGEVCPAQWRSGQSGMVASAEGAVQYLRDHLQHGATEANHV